MAARVEHAFCVQSPHGLLDGKPGDYLMKHSDQEHVAYPDDVWIVDQEIFMETYEPVD